MRNLVLFFSSSSSIALSSATTLFVLASSRLTSITLKRLYRFSIFRLTSESGKKRIGVLYVVKRDSVQSSSSLGTSYYTVYRPDYPHETTLS